MKLLRSLLIFSALAAPLPLMAADFGVRYGSFSDSDQDFVGAEMLFDLGAFNLNPNIEYSLEDDVTAGSGNIDLLFEIAPGAKVQPFLGAGVGLSYVDAAGDSQSDLLGNAIGGIAIDLDYIEPYFQVKYVKILENDDSTDDDDDIAFTIGLRF